MEGLIKIGASVNIKRTDGEYRIVIICSAFIYCGSINKSLSVVKLKKNP